MQPSKSHLSRLVDEYGDLQQKAAAWQPAVNPHLQRLQEVEAELLALQAKEPAAKPIVLEGAKWKVPVSACKKTTTLIAKQIPELFKRMGSTWIEKNCLPTLAAVRAAVAKNDLSVFLQEGRGTQRTIGQPVRKGVA